MRRGICKSRLQLRLSPGRDFTKHDARLPTATRSPSEPIAPVTTHDVDRPNVDPRTSLHAHPYPLHSNSSCLPRGKSADLGATRTSKAEKRKHLRGLGFSARRVVSREAVRIPHEDSGIEHVTALVCHLELFILVREHNLSPSKSEASTKHAK